MMIFAKWIDEDGRFAFSETDNGGVEITNEQHAAVIAGNQDGRAIGRDANNKPVLIELTLDALKSIKINGIKNDVITAIIGGIDHDTLGSVHHYPTTSADQANLNGLISRSQLIGEAGAPYKFWCADASGTWARRGHTLAQIQALGLAVAAHVIAAQDLYEAKLAAIDAATNETELNLITWS